MNIKLKTYLERLQPSVDPECHQCPASDESTGSCGVMGENIGHYLWDSDKAPQNCPRRITNAEG